MLAVVSPTEHPRGGTGRDPEEARIAEAVRAFYEQHSYPRPVQDLDRYRERWSDPRRRRVEHHRFFPERPFGTARSVLVAGCGTAQAARHALRGPEDRVVGIDVSEASIEATRALKERHGLDNLELARLPLEEARALGHRFDLVVCTGVLHHLPDPERGLMALSSVLAPGGAMYLMVYAPYGRAGVYLIQHYCRLLGVRPSRSEIRELAATLSVLPAAHPLRPLIENSADFRSEAGLADALLHPHDRAYSVPELFGLVAAADLRFDRWIRQAPYLPQCGAPLLTPHRERLARLPAIDQYTAMELFRGNMTRHGAVLRRRSDGDGHAIDFAGDEWLRWIPAREQDSVCVEQGIPDSAAAVLINRRHTDPDLNLPINAAQKRLLDAIDGERTIGDMIAGDAGIAAARAFFERLWWYDQVVFDTSGEEADAASCSPPSKN